MLRRRGKTRTIASLVAMVVAALVGFYAEAHLDELGTALDRPLEAQEPATTRVEAEGSSETVAEKAGAMVVVPASRSTECEGSTFVLVHPVPPATL